MPVRFRLELDVAPDRCEYLMGDGLAAEIGPRVARFVSSPTCVVVTDTNVAVTPQVETAEASLRRAGLAPRRVVVRAGEKSKSVESAAALWTSFAEAGLARDGAVIAIGGGVVGDLAGFCAATWMRGVVLVHVPTSLLAMCDSSVGGKCAVDLSAAKNLVGAFHQPRLIAADSGALATLPDRELRSGVAEAVKCAMLRDRESLLRLRDAAERIAKRDADAVAQTVQLAVEVKADLIRGDVHDTEGRRALLNLGHTTGHAIEAESGYGTVTHGEAVAIGLVTAARVALVRELCDEKLVASLLETLAAFELPVALPPGLDVERIVARTLLDKKRAAARRRMVLPLARGGAELHDVDDAELRAALAPA
jgi:3-dehydroquinate synthase